MPIQLAVRMKKNRLPTSGRKDRPRAPANCSQGVSRASMANSAKFWRPLGTSAMRRVASRLTTITTAMASQAARMVLVTGTPPTQLTSWPCSSAWPPRQKMISATSDGGWKFSMARVPLSLRPPARRIVAGGRFLAQEDIDELYDAEDAGYHPEQRAYQVGDRPNMGPAVHQQAQTQSDQDRRGQHETELGGDGDGLPDGELAHEAIAPAANSRQYSTGPLVWLRLLRAAPSGAYRASFNASLTSSIEGRRAPGGAPC